MILFHVQPKIIHKQLRNIEIMFHLIYLDTSFHNLSLKVEMPKPETMFIYNHKSKQISTSYIAQNTMRYAAK